ncbi:MAG: hypothetical protein HZB76_01515 [Chlamydiae bacterium]|nr:hypothetical protein [Chlamydiota bacterium]
MSSPNVGIITSNKFLNFLNDNKKSIMFIAATTITAVALPVILGLGLYLVPALFCAGFGCLLGIVIVSLYNNIKVSKELAVAKKNLEPQPAPQQQAPEIALNMSPLLRQIQKQVKMTMIIDLYNFSITPKVDRSALERQLISNYGLTQEQITTLSDDPSKRVILENLYGLITLAMSNKDAPEKPSFQIIFTNIKDLPEWKCIKK